MKTKASLEGSCHCGRVRLRLPFRPRTVADCNCSICRRYGVLWAYYRRDPVEIVAANRATAGYAWGERSIRFVRCGRCGCVTHWEPLHASSTDRVGINTRLFDPDVLGTPRVRRLDGARRKVEED